MNKHFVITLHRQRGLSLVELMIGLTLGLILLLGIIQVFISSKQTFATNDAMAKLQENGRFALEFITQSARQAGYTSPGSTLSRPFPVERTVCGLGNSGSNPCAFNGNGSAADVVGFTFEPPIIDGAKRDCAGREVPDNVLIVNSFFILGSDANNPTSSLACRSFRRDTGGEWSSQQRLIDGIDSLQVLYGIDTGGNSQSVNQYVSADRVSNWGKVVSVRIAVLANSVDVLNPAPVQRNYYLLDAAPFSSNDGRARQVFTTTVQFKNL
ncbi:PilW family protein [Pseudomonas sp. zfem003]|uniref:PilW family protein n=1 Tax=Pseudomonas sp. zfem003 TaxID=3078198 RepID=UPI0029283EDD|nr:PilW family protein [Pseudomonas sp. zfem003]MDU9397284.1 PilW family protein [Pseudomonas sp. zfem003]